MTILVTQAAAAPRGRDVLPQAPAAKTLAKASQAGVAKPEKTLPPEIVNALNFSVRGGKNGVLAGVFDAVYRNPNQRDQVIDYARGLAPGLARDLTTAADLGVLTSGQRLTLAPNAAQVMTARSAASGIGASAYAAPVMVPMANSPSPNLPLSASTFAQTWNLDLIGANTAYSRGFTGKDASNNPVYVAVGDTGFDVNNSALRNKLDLTRAKNYILVNPGDTYDPTDVGVQSTDAKDQHGSHVAGLIAAEKFDNVAMHGVAYDAKVVPIRVISAGASGGAPEAATAPGFSDADALNYFASLNNVMVYNASYGPSLPDGTPPQSVWTVSPGTAEEVAAASNALKAGKIIVAAAGNERDDHPVAGRNPSGLALYPFIRPEHANVGVYTDGGAKLDYSSLLTEQGLIIGVMSIGIQETSPGSGIWQKIPASYSNFCGVTASWCVAAPGGNVATDGGVYSTVPVDNYAALQGTSMAAPTVSGAIAVLIGAYPNYNARDLARVLFSTAEDLGAPGVDAVYGYGLIRLDRATDGPTTLAAGATQTVAANTTVYWSQPLTTSGGFNKDGDGVLTIAGRTSAPGNVTVLGGTLAVDGTLGVTGAGNALIVNRGSTLAGIGEIDGTTTIAGTLSPGKMANVADLIANGVISSGASVVGNSAGLLTFNGSVTLMSTATTRIDIDGTLIVPGGPGTYDRIVVTGAGNLFSANGMLTPVLRDSVGTPSNYTPTIGTQFKFVETTDGARTAGGFTSLVQPTSGLPVNGRFDVIYAPTSITLTVTPLSFASLTSGSLDKNQQSVAGALDAARPAAGTVPNSAAKTLFDALYSFTSPSSYSTAFGQLSGSSQPAVTSAAATAFTGFMGSLADRQNALMLGAADTQEAASQAIAFSYADNTPSAEARQAADAFASAMPVAPSKEGWGVWGQAFGRWSTVGDAGGLQGSKSRSGGFTLGADKLLANDLIGGLAMGFTRTTTDASGGNGTSNSYSGAIYASWTPGRAVIDMRAALGQTQVQTSRTTSLTPSAITGSTKGLGGSLGIEAGYMIAVAQFTVKPYAGITWQGLRLNGYSETQQPYGLTYPAQTFDKLTTTLGVAFSTTTRVADAVTLMPELKLGWAHDLRDTTLVSQAALLDSAFSVNAADPGRDAALVGLKLAGWTRESLRLFVAYNGEFRSNATSHQVTGGGRVTW
ncbi:autotransporter domain-containing protein [Microbacteriaceae bacterium K1510]|nr:autotransporter domain-containing protein [Microbacteriaceae bacterium K1510]